MVTLFVQSNLQAMKRERGDETKEENEPCGGSDTFDWTDKFTYPSSSPLADLDMSNCASSRTSRKNSPCADSDHREAKRIRSEDSSDPCTDKDSEMITYHLDICSPVPLSPFCSPCTPCSDSATPNDDLFLQDFMSNKTKPSSKDQSQLVDDIIHGGGKLPAKMFSDFVANKHIKRVSLVYVSDEVINVSDGVNGVSDDMNDDERRVIGHLLLKTKDLPGMLYPSKDTNKYSPAHISKRDVLSTYNFIGLSEVINDIEVNHDIGIVDIMFEIERYDPNDPKEKEKEKESVSDMPLDKLTQFASCVVSIDKIDNVLQRVNDLTRPLALAFEIDGVDLRSAYYRKMFMDLDAHL